MGGAISTVAAHPAGYGPAMSKRAIVITGVSTGIGYGCAQAFLRGGYRVYGSVRKQADAERLQRELGEGFRPLLFDITDWRRFARRLGSIPRDSR